MKKIINRIIAIGLSCFLLFQGIVYTGVTNDSFFHEIEASEIRTFSSIHGIKINSDKIREIANQYLGAPYGYAEKGDSSNFKAPIDCSGFVTTVYKRYLKTITPDNGTNKLWGQYGWNSVLPNGNIVGYSTTDQYGIGPISDMGTKSWEDLIISKNIYCSKVLKIEKTTKKNKYGQYIWKAEEPAEGWEFWHCGDIVQWTGDPTGKIEGGADYHIGLYWGPDQTISASGGDIPGVGKECTMISKISDISYHQDPHNKNVAYYKLYKMVPFAPYKITYILGGGTNNKDNPKTYTSQTPTITLKNPTKKGFVFKGWYTDKNYKNKVTQIQLGSVGNKTLYAKWEAVKYQIQYVLSRGTNNKENPTEYTITTPTIALKNPTKKGYSFVGWYSNKNFTNKISQITKGTTGNKRLYAKWERIMYTITYELNGGEMNMYPDTYTIADSFDLPVPTKEGYTFAGWYSDPEFTKKKDGIKKYSVGNLKVFAKWEPAIYTISYDLDGGEMDSYPDTYTLTDAFNFPIPTKAGYTFAGWYSDPEFAEKKDGISEGETGNLELFAKWEN